MRVALVTAFYLLWAAVVAAQTPIQAVVGRTYAIVAEHDGAGTDGYRLRDGATIISQQPAVTLINGQVTFPAWVATEGSHSLTVSAFNASGEAVSAPILVLAAQPQTPPPSSAGCPDYVTPQGVPTPKAAGDVIQGWNNFDLGALAGMQAYTARLVKLVRWGFTVDVDGVRVATVNGRQYPQVHLKATCDGVTATPSVPPPSDRQSVPPQQSITAPDGAVWTLDGVRVMRNGVHASGGGGDEIVLAGGVVYVRLGASWYRWTGTGWATQATAP